MHQKISQPILKIDDVTPYDASGFGEKGTRLREMSAKGFKVPDGLLLSTSYFDKLLDVTQMNDLENKIVEKESDGFEAISTLVNTFRESLKYPDSFRQELLSCLETIRGYTPETKFAVRSAAKGEDGENNSFAGQYASILDIRRDQVCDAIIDCYVSWWTPRAIKYRKMHHILPSTPNISVIVQRLVQPDFAGVLFTRHPFQGTHHMVIEAVTGLGEKLVSGEVKPAEWTLDRDTLKILSHSEDPERKAMQLSRKFLKELVRMGKELEKEFGQGLDIEWAIENQTLYILQLRPITTLDLESVFRDGTSTIEKLSRHIYSRTVVEDLWSDRMTPMTSSIIFDRFADVYTYKRELTILGLHDIAAIKSIRVINGYGYLNTEAIARMMELIPPLFRFKELTAVFPPSIREQDIHIPFNLKKCLSVLIRLPGILNDPAMIPIFTKRILKTHLKTIDRELGQALEQATLNDLSHIKHTLLSVLTILKKLLVRNQWGYGHASTSTWIFCHLAENMAKARPEWILQQLTHIPENPTFLIQTELRDLLQSLPPELQMAINQKPTGEFLNETLGKPELAAFKHALKTFVDTYYYRSSNRDFIHARWKEKPAIVIDLLKIVAEGHKEFSTRKQPERAFKHWSPLNVVWYPLLKGLSHSARVFLALREDLRVGLDKVFYEIRHLLLKLNQKAPFNQLEAEDAIFFFELDEILRICDGEPLSPSLVQTVMERRQSYEKDKNASPPYYVKIKGNVAKDLSHKRKILRKVFGTPASPGIIKGYSKIIFNEDDFHKLKPEDILIAYNTDPGWTPLFSTARGVIVEMGGILNHCAIVAREYGIPAIVGVSGATRLFHDGQYLRVNGATGQIDILESR